jgi:hypothetical protein
MHETQKIDSGHTDHGPTRPHRAFVQCGCGRVCVDTTVGILRLDDTNVHAFLGHHIIILPHENTQTTASSKLPLPRQTNEAHHGNRG